jgi:acyl-homoserine-lactone acylase
MLTTDHAENSNDSDRLPSATARITGLPKLVGDVATERSLRTRGVIAELEEQKTKAPYTRKILADAMLSNRSYAADLVAREVVALCRAASDDMLPSTAGEPVAVSAACEAIEAWDHAMSIDSPGAYLFSKVWVRALQTSNEAGVSPWTVPFDPEDPVRTPNTLDRANPSIARPLADTVQELNAAGISVTAKLGAFQYVVRNGEKIPIGGGTDQLGVMNLITGSSELDNHDDPSNGSGYMQSSSKRKVATARLRRCVLAWRRTS